jgi:hypothetical protein
MIGKVIIIIIKIVILHQCIDVTMHITSLGNAVQIFCVIYFQDFILRIFFQFTKQHIQPMMIRCIGMSAKKEKKKKAYT